MGPERLSEDQIQENLKSIPGWALKMGEITRLYKFKDFVDSMNFVNQVAQLAEQADHHPDIFIQYNKVVLTLSTHSASGLTQKDFQLAKEIDLPGNRS